MSHDGISLPDSAHNSISKRGPLAASDRLESFISTGIEEGDQEVEEIKGEDPADLNDDSAPAQMSEESPEPEDLVRKGILQKQGGLFGMWSKKFFLLEEGVLSYYESSQAYLSGARPSKQMLLTGSTELSYTKMSHCFKIRTDDTEFVLMSENKDLMREWIADLRTVVTALYDARIKSLMHSKKN